MNQASQKEAIEEIKEIAALFPYIRMFIVDDSGTIRGSSFALPSNRSDNLLQQLEKRERRSEIATTYLFDRKVYLKHAYFPFWRWHIVSFIPEDDYFKPLLMAKRIVHYGNFGTLAAMVASFFLLFLLRINRPLQRIISTTREIQKGNFDKVNLQGNDEIVRVASSFDSMVDKLKEERQEINRILKELGESEDKYRILSENSLTLVMVVTSDAFQYINGATAAFFEMPYESLMAKSIYSLFSDGQDQILRQRITALTKEESVREHVELRYHAPSGQEKWLEMLATVIPYQGTPAILCHCLDITQRKHMEENQEALRVKAARGEKMEMLGTLAGGVAHDLNNILSGIVSYPELLLQGLEPNDSLYAPLQTINQSGVKAAAIVQDLLTLTRRGVIVTHIISLKTVIEDYLASPEHQKLLSHHPNLSIQCHIDEKLLNIQGSGHHLSKTIMNMVFNAAEAIPEEGGNIWITVKNQYIDSPMTGYEEVVEGEYVVVTVSDDGKGISEQDLNKIFEPFYTKKVMGRSGTGLGMSVVWGTVKDHKGYIEVTSEKDEGAVFTLYFPASRDELNQEEPTTLPTLRKGRGEKILVVDDVEEQLIIATSILQRLGYTVETAASGEQAIEMVEGAAYHVIILDMIMDPGMDGLTTYGKILDINPSQKAIIASGFSETWRVRRTMELGAGSYIKKPYTIETLAAAIQKEL
ncbi:MAG: ATP-binding protein [Desulfopila sp.]